MERTGRLLARWKSAARVLTPEEMVVAAWPSAVGKRLADRTRAVGVVRTRLVVEVEDVLWQKNLHALRKDILKNMRDVLGDQAPADVEFRIGAPRRGPHIEGLPASGFARPVDEADRIADPVLSRLYRAARRKATA